MNGSFGVEVGEMRYIFTGVVVICYYIHTIMLSYWLFLEIQISHVSNYLVFFAFVCLLCSMFAG